MRIPKRYANKFSQEVEEFGSRVNYRYMVISKLISIEVLWESFYPNIPINGELYTMFILLQTSYIIIFLVPCHPPMSIRFFDQSFPANHLSRAQGKLPSPQSFQNHSRRDYRQVQSSHITCQDLQPSMVAEPYNPLNFLTIFNFFTNHPPSTHTR